MMMISIIVEEMAGLSWVVRSSVEVDIAAEASAAEALEVEISEVEEPEVNSDMKNLRTEKRHKSSQKQPLTNE